MTDPGHQAIGGGRYKLIRVLGQGGMATVYRAHDTRLGVDRAIKILSSQYCASANIRARFQSEARTMARLRHPNILSVHDVELDGHQVYMVMELLRGGTLWDWVLAYGRMPARMAAQVMIPVLEAIEVAHGAGVIHRDLKPQNILLTGEGAPKVTDFGIARVADRNSALTKTTAVLGTQGYMAPEQRTASRNVDVRSDVYSLGATLWALVTGQTPVDLIALAIDEALLDGVEESLARIIRVAAAYKPDDRYQDTREFCEALRAALLDLPEIPPGTAALGDLPELPEVDDGHLGVGSGTLDLSPPSQSSGASESSETFMLAEDALSGPGEDPHDLRGATSIGDPEPEVQIAPAEEPPRRRSWMGIALGLVFGIGGAAWYVVSQPEQPAPAPKVQVAPPPATIEDEGVPEPEPVVEPEPEPEPGVEPEPEPVTDGTWSWSGDAVRVTLVGADGSRHGPGTVPAGKYQILAVFDEAAGAITAGSTTVSAGGSRAIQCNPIFQKCQ